VIPFESVVLLNNLGVHKRHEEYGGKHTETASNTESDRDDIAWWLLVESKFGRTFIHNGERANGAGNEEEEWRSIDSPGNRVPAHVNDELDEEEDGRGEAGGAQRCESETREDSLSCCK